MIEHIKTRGHPPANQRVPFDTGAPYDCPELKRPPGIDEARFVAFNLPSIVHGQRVYPKRKV